MICKHCDGELYLFDDNAYIGEKIYKCRKCGSLDLIKSQGGKKE